ncbi:MAG TPA: formylmethanofuran dehydrogenase subunit C [Gemmatimonadales bacterium]|nr:formylmethanofuran dehydrogenase subunit C [Gemmatimonadales bacterium]
MSDEVVLTLKRALDRRVDASALALDLWAELDESAIARQGVRVAAVGLVPLGEFFEVRGGRSHRIRFAGDLTQIEGLGTGLDGAEVVIEGAAGRATGARMRSGRIEVHGDAGWGAGLELAGGVLDVRGNVGPRAGGAPLGAKRGMTGGVVIVRGSAGPEAGAAMRRGLVAVAGDVGESAGRAVIAGTVVVFGAVGPNPGRWSRRGSIVALGNITPPATYAYACTYRPEYVAFLLKHLAERHRMAPPREHSSGLYRRYSGDLAELGAGEILAWTPNR